MSFPCIACDDEFGSCEALAIHLVAAHKHVTRWLEKKPSRFKNRVTFKVYQAWERTRILCFCGRRFLVMDARDVAPHFVQYVNRPEIAMGDFINHLGRADGIVAHLDALRAKVLLDKIAYSLNGVS
jgi:hypothetical protein